MNEGDRGGGSLLEAPRQRMSYLKLIKLLYLLDREALLRGQAVTTDDTFDGQWAWSAESTI